MTTGASKADVDNYINSDDKDDNGEELDNKLDEKRYKE
jgi:hypothetical protein